MDTLGVPLELASCWGCLVNEALSPEVLEYMADPSRFSLQDACQNQHKLNRATHCNPRVAPLNVEGSPTSAVPLLWVWRRPAVAEDVIQAALQTRTLDAFPVCLEHVVR